MFTLTTRSIGLDYSHVEIAVDSFLVEGNLLSQDELKALLSSLIEASSDVADCLQDSTAHGKVNELQTDLEKIGAVS